MQPCIYTLHQGQGSQRRAAIEGADALAAAAAETDPARDVEPDLDPEAGHFLFKGKWVEWDII